MKGCCQYDNWDRRCIAIIMVIFLLLKVTNITKTLLDVCIVAHLASLFRISLEKYENEETYIIEMSILTPY